MAGNETTTHSIAEGILLLILIALVIGVGLYNPRFLNERNLTDIINTNAYIAVAAIGISMIIITGNIDISVGAAIGVLVSLSPNPSHLEAVDPVVVGIARAKQERVGSEEARRHILPVLVHGDAAFAGHYLNDTLTLRPLA